MIIKIIIALASKAITILLLIISSTDNNYVNINVVNNDNDNVLEYASLLMLFIPFISNITLQILVSYRHTLLITETGRIS